MSVEIHDGVEIIEEAAFAGCSSLRGIKLPGVRVIEKHAFFHCTALADVEFGDKLESIGDHAFQCCRLTNIKLPKVRNIGKYAFTECEQLTEVELPKDLERIEGVAFHYCRRLRRIAIPLKDNLLGYYVFDDCDNLSQVDLIGGIHKTISSLLLDSWRNEMNDEIDRINRDLPNTSQYRKTAVFRRWMERVTERIEHYKSEQYALLKNNMSLLELALWKVKLHEYGDAKEFSFSSDLRVLMEKKMTLLEFAHCKAKFDEEFVAARQNARVKCGANIIIPHVLSFLNDDDVFPLLGVEEEVGGEDNSIDSSSDASCSSLYDESSSSAY